MALGFWETNGLVSPNFGFFRVQKIIILISLNLTFAPFTDLAVLLENSTTVCILLIFLCHRHVGKLALTADRCIWTCGCKHTKVALFHYVLCTLLRIDSRVLTVAKSAFIPLVAQRFERLIFHGKLG